MSARVSQGAKAGRPLAHYGNLVLGGGIVACALALLVAVRLGWIDIIPQYSEVAAPHESEPAHMPTIVQLTAGKFAAADLHTTAVVEDTLQLTRPVPATITYDAARKVPVHAPVGGVLTKVSAEPGQPVDLHQPLAELSSPDVGLARDEVLKHQAELELAQQQLSFSEQIATGVEELLKQLRQKPTLEDLDELLAKHTLGEYRQTIVPAYSKLALAERVVKSTDALAVGVLSEQLVAERRSNREVAAAQFAAACETARFAATQERGKAKAAAEQAERHLAVAQQSLANLLGPISDMTPVTDRRRLSELVLLAPMAGRVEERSAVTALRVSAGAPLFVLADTSVLWVSVEIHERDWSALEVAPGGDIRVRIPALDNAEFNASVRFVGSRVAEDTRSVPLVAELPNPDGRLKPGLFAWALAPLESPRQAVVVPQSAIMRHENQPFVFVPGGERTFRRVDVAVGVESNGRVEITGGLKPGDTVVDRGAFFLKSELLLEREE
jgi:RND family efflux transporter MFP subunit